jgi:branched-chain amino acid transport system substrate-binding protein
MAAALLCACLFAVGCRAPSRPVVIGVIAMIDGPNAESGRSMVNASSLAVKELNSRGGLRLGGERRRVSLIVEADPNNPEGALDAARSLITKKGAVALIGPQFSGNAIPVARLAESSGVVMIAPMSTNPETTRGKRFVFRIPYLDTFQGLVLARLSRDPLGFRRGAVLFDVAGDYNRMLAEEFRRVFEESGGSIVAWESYTTDRNHDFGPQLRRIRDAHPEVLLLPNYTSDVREQAAQARAVGITATFLGGDGWGDALASESAVDGSYFTRHWHPTLASGGARRFSAAYESVYGQVPGDVAATTWDACGILFAAMEAAGSASPEAVQSALHTMGAFEGVTGRITYSSSGDPTKSAVIVRFSGGKEEVNAVVEP